MTTKLNSTIVPALILCALAPFADLPSAPAAAHATTTGYSVTYELPPARPYVADSSDTDQRPVKSSKLSTLVSAYDDIEPSTYAADCLARAVYFESRSEPLEGQLAVAEVILNRTKDKKFASNVCDVVREPAQFSFVSNGVIPNPNASSRSWHKAIAIAHIAMHKLTRSRASKALYYHADYVAPTWRLAFAKQAQLGAHIFYR